MTDRILLNQIMRALVKKAGGPANAASYIDAGLGIPMANGESSRAGTISRRLSGHLDWTLVDILALEDALGDYRVRRWLAQSLPEAGESADLMSCITETSREVGEAVGAVAEFASGRCEKVHAQKEVQEARQALERMQAVLEGGEE